MLTAVHVDDVYLRSRICLQFLNVSFRDSQKGP